MENTKIVPLIQEKLREIEQKESVNILYAVESGSRSWGFASPDSDYDVRFIYVRTPRDYLRLDQKRDVIEWEMNEVYDINGWDIRNALLQFYKSNATVFEWSNSPIVYQEKEEWKQIYATAKAYFSVKTALYHYYGVAKSTYCQFLCGEEVKYKKYFYALRPLLSCRYLWEHRCPPPIVFSELMQVELPGELRKEIEALLEKKKQTMEGERHSPIPAVQKFISDELEIWKQRAEEIKEEKKGDWEALNQVIWDLTGISAPSRRLFMEARPLVGA